MLIRNATLTDGRNGVDILVASGRIAFGPRAGQQPVTRRAGCLRTFSAR